MLKKAIKGWLSKDVKSARQENPLAFSLLKSLRRNCYSSGISNPLQITLAHFQQVSAPGQPIVYHDVFQI